MRTLSQIIIKPLMTELSVKDAGKGKYTFLVGMDANKTDIKKAVEKLFKVTVKKVFTNTVKEKRIRVTKIGKSVTDLSYKKARVQLAQGQKLDIFEEQGNEKKDTKEAKK